MANVNYEVRNALFNRHTLKLIKMASKQLDRKIKKSNSPKQRFPFGIVLLIFRGDLNHSQGRGTAVVVERRNPY